MDSSKKKLIHTAIAAGVKLKSWGDWGGICPYCKKPIGAGDHYVQQAYGDTFHSTCFWKAECGEWGDVDSVPKEL